MKRFLSSIGERTCIQMIRIHELVCQHASRSVTVSQGPGRRHQRLDHQEVVSISVDLLMQAPCSPMPAKRKSEYQLLFDGYGTRAGDAASCKPDREGPFRSTVTTACSTHPFRWRLEQCTEQGATVGCSTA